MAGAAGLHLVAGVALLRPEEQVFEAMVDGWRCQQVLRNLSFSTVEGRLRRVRAFTDSAGCFPWAWTPQAVCCGNWPAENWN
jgi:integrase/recombinase XerC